MAEWGIATAIGLGQRVPRSPLIGEEVAVELGEVTVDGHRPSLWVIRLAGEHDLSNVSQVRAALEVPCDTGGSVVVDLDECEFID